MNLERWILLARESWQDNNPSLFKELCSSGRLDQALRDAAERTHQEMNELEEQGFSNQEAWEMTREKYLLIPAEPEKEEEVNKGAALFNQIIALQNEMLRLDSDEDS